MPENFFIVPLSEKYLSYITKALTQVCIQGYDPCSRTQSKQLLDYIFHCHNHDPSTIFTESFRFSREELRFMQNSLKDQGLEEYLNLIDYLEGVLHYD